MATMAIEPLVEAAGLIVVGTMQSSSTLEEPGTVSVSWEMKVTDVLNGSYSGDVIEFHMVTKGAFPDWAVPVPRSASPGETWIVFLRERQSGFIPFAGLNGMLKVEGEKLIYDNAVDHRLTRSQVTSIVRSIQDGVQH